MPTHEEIMGFVSRFLTRWVQTVDDIWVAIYRLLLDYNYGVPRITDSNRLRTGSRGEKIWRERAKQLEDGLAAAMKCKTSEAAKQLDVFMRQLYPPGMQRMNPVGIAFACAIVYLIQRFSLGGRNYGWKMEAKIGVDVFPNLTGFRRKSVDIVALR